ncbi:MAG: hypothetical protein PUG67_05920 [Peptoniphilaceae bacterium]|nr:hypothetical protein [Peptoniphilaceae bacterium]MDY6018072.1 hypothetical protein [Anaerococcus sp.]
MILLNDTLQLDNKNTLSHKKYIIKLARAYDQLLIKMCYSPAYVDQEKSDILIKSCIDKYVPDFYKNSFENINNFKVENLITTSLKYENEYLGAYHNKTSNQEIIISPKMSSLGYISHDVLAGDYALTLSFHSVNSEITLKLLVEAKDVQ